MHGRLHEVAAALDPYSPNEFIQLPAGQVALMLEKVDDLVASGRRELEYAAEEFLNLLLTRSILLPGEQYRRIVKPAMQWGFERDFDGRKGRDSVRRTLELAVEQATGESYEVLRQEFSELMKQADLEDQEEWYLHSVRLLVQTLLANPSCTSGAEEMAAVLNKVNEIQRERPRPARLRV